MNTDCSRDHKVYAAKWGLASGPPLGPVQFIIQEGTRLGGGWLAADIAAGGWQLAGGWRGRYRVWRVVAGGWLAPGALRNRYRSWQRLAAGSWQGAWLAPGAWWRDWLAGRGRRHRYRSLRLGWRLTYGWLACWLAGWCLAPGPWQDRYRGWWLAAGAWRLAIGGCRDRYHGWRLVGTGVVNYTDRFGVVCISCGKLHGPLRGRVHILW